MPNRIIKESICRSDSIDSLSWFEEVLFYRLIVVCDDFGRFDGRPAIIKGSCFPLKDDITKKHISAAIDKLSTVGLVRGYEVQGRPYLQLTAWDCHQQIRAKNSKYPSPDDDIENQSPGRSDTGLCDKETSSDISLYHLISNDIKCPRESRIDNRESIIENREERRARATVEVRRFEDFWSVYPKKLNKFLAQNEYASLIMSGKATEDELVQCAANYADSCKASETPDKYIKKPENFIRDMTFEDYMPGKYKRPSVDKKKKNSFHNFEQRDVDYDNMAMEILKKRLKT